jgi:hypothetical protein
LRHAENLGCAGDVAALGDRDEDAELFEGHVNQQAYSIGMSNIRRFS